MVKTNFNELEAYKNIFEKDSNGRIINIYNIKNSLLVGESLFYPNPLLYSIEKNIIYNPIVEKTMSLENIDIKNDIQNIDLKIINIENNPLFFFIYNTDNYYHFIYDTLPYLISFLDLKKEISNLKLLMTYPNQSKKDFYKFVIEFLELIGISLDDIIIAKNNTLYKNIFISNSYTHDFDSNAPPRKEIYNFFKEISNKVNKTNKIFPKKIYISRRSWIHNDFSNIGTNYTTRRRLVNEDELVSFLVKQGYEEVFTETLSTIEKIELFSNAEEIVGTIGGGICNVLFAKENTKLFVINSPYFLDINQRFKYSFMNVDYQIFMDSEHTENTEFKSSIRIKTNDGIIGEIVDIENNNITIIYQDTATSGWNSEVEYKKLTTNINLCTKLDNGLNSSWKFNLTNFKKTYFT
jgi:hypothetical protein